MSKMLSYRRLLAKKFRNRVETFFYSEGGGKVANFAPVAQILRTLTYIVLRSGTAPTTFQHDDDTSAYVAGANMQPILDNVVRDVVCNLGYVAAMIATYEKDDSLPSRAFFIDPAVASMAQVRQWEREIAKLTSRPISITDPNIARVYVHRDEYQENLSVRATRGGTAVISNEMYSLFVPIVPPASRPIVGAIQQEIGVQQVVAVPFFLEDAGPSTGNGSGREIVGNLFAMKRSTISKEDLDLLSAFAHQASTAILSERQRLQIQISQELVFQIQRNLINEDVILQRIAEGVVRKLDYIACMVATYEPDDSLPLRAFFIDPAVASMARVHQWEQELAAFTSVPVSITDPNIARVYVHQQEYEHNLSVQAARAGKPIISNEMYTLFMPIVPPAARPIVGVMQQELGVQQVVAVPFFLEDPTTDHGTQRELVGNVFVFTRSLRVTGSELHTLQLFGQQAAAGLQNARVYRQSEHRRQIAQLFGRMAFSAAASVHDLRGHVGVVRGNVSLLERAVAQIDDERQRKRFQENIQVAQKRLDAMADLLQHLHEPWSQIADEPTDVNTCIRHALRKVMPEQPEWISLDLADDLPLVSTAPAMLTEAIRVLIKNALEATHVRGNQHRIWIASARPDDDDPSTIVVSVRDNGEGIRPEDMARIFEMRWTTKRTGLGFGLFWTREYIEGLGGWIMVESEWQQGTLFRLILPCQAAASAAQGRRVEG
jgi:signal transduction histidine kinase